MLWLTDNAYDLGASGATRPRTGYFGTSVITPALTVSGLTSGRIPYLTTGGLFTSSGNLTFDGSNLGNSGTYLNGQISTFNIATSSNYSPISIAGDKAVMSAGGQYTPLIFISHDAASIRLANASIQFSTGGSSKVVLDSNGNFTLQTGSLYLNNGQTIVKGFTDNVAEYLINSLTQTSWTPYMTYTSSGGTANRGYIWGAYNNSGQQNPWMALWNGYLGVGTTSPNALIHTIAADGTTADLARFQQVNQGNLLIQSQQGSQNLGGSNGILFSNATGVIGWRTNATSGSAQMLLTANGSLALGTTNATGGALLTLQESSTNATALSMLNRNSNQKWSIAVDATAVDDKILAFIDATNAVVRMGLNTSSQLVVGTTGIGSQAASSGNFYDFSGQPIYLCSIAPAGQWYGTLAGTTQRICGALGNTGDPAYGYILLVPAYNGTLLNASVFTGKVYRFRGASYAGLEAYAAEITVASGYNSNFAGGVNFGNGQWEIVTCSYGGTLYIAIRTGLTSAGSMVIDGIYTNNFTPILVSDGSVSTVTVLKTLS
jgi:hypothetical protein